ncbi:nitrous oxide reductase family maturation protein NosD [Bdellovibrio sp. HCB274]|uniref:right-handed parallel beta-helix repeat-containing protein n=1 Tax=Bdellovibrio sp. HCB274 TaxID=3394361 RepID=UPI0039B56CD3
MKLQARYLAGLVLCLLCSEAFSADIYVSANGTDSGNCQNSSQPCQTISYGIGASSDGDTVHIAPGSYAETGPIAINNSISIVGPQAGVDARQRVILGYSEATINIGHGFVVNANRVSFDGLQLVDSNMYAIQISTGFHGATIQNNIFRNNPNSLGLANNGASPLVVSKNAFLNGKVSAAIIVYNGNNYPISNVIVSDNLFRDNAPVAIDFEGWGPTATHSNITIENNNIQNSKYGIIFQTTGSSIVTGNTFENPPEITAIGIWIIGSNDGITVTQNSFSGGSYGVYLNQLSGYANSNIDVNRNSFGNFSEGGVGASVMPLQREGFASCNWWGDASGPKYPLNPDGTGAALVGEFELTDFEPWLKTANLNGICGNEPPPPPDDSKTSPDFAGTWRAGDKCLVISSDLIATKSSKAFGPIRIKSQDGLLMSFGTPLEPAGVYTRALITYDGKKPKFQEVRLQGKNRLKVDEYYKFGNRNPLNHFDTETYHRVRRCGWKKHVFPPQPKPNPSSVSSTQAQLLPSH